jgi:hypothetical protein
MTPKQWNDLIETIYDPQRIEDETRDEQARFKTVMHIKINGTWHHDVDGGDATMQVDVKGGWISFNEPDDNDDNEGTLYFPCSSIEAVKVLRVYRPWNEHDDDEQPGHKG